MTRKISEDYGSYYHERFLLGYPDLAGIIQRTVLKGTGAQKISSPETEPDFQTMKPSGMDVIAKLNIMSKQTTKLENNRSMDEHKIKYFVEIDSVHDSKLHGTIKSEIQPNLHQDSSNTI